MFLNTNDEDPVLKANLNRSQEVFCVETMHNGVAWRCMALHMLMPLMHVLFFVAWTHMEHIATR